MVALIVDNGSKFLGRTLYGLTLKSRCLRRDLIDEAQGTLL